MWKKFIIIYFPIVLHTFRQNFKSFCILFARISRVFARFLSKRKTSFVHFFQKWMAFYNWVKKRQLTTYLHIDDFLVNIGKNTLGVVKDDKKDASIKQFSWQNPSKVLHIDIDKKTIVNGFKEMKENGLDNFYWHHADISSVTSLKNLIEQKILHIPKSVNVFSSYSTLDISMNTSREKIETLLKWMSTFLADDGYFIGIFTNEEVKQQPQELTKQQPKAEIKQWPQELTKQRPQAWQRFVECAEKFGLRLISTEMFEDLYKHYPNSNLNLDEMKIAFLNQTFVFQK
jgi:hypothetical protein